jgi:hypothetical protein
MRAVLVLGMIVVGLLLLATPGLPAGLALIAAGAWIGVPGRTEDRFTTALMLLGGAGAIAMIVRFAWERLA